MQSQRIGVLAALCATIIWSGNFIVARGIAHDISAIELNFWRWLIATAIVLPFAIKPMCREWEQVYKHKWYMFFMALTGISLMNTMLYHAGQSTSSINMALLFPCSPILIMILSRIIYGEVITPRRFLGMLIVLVGILSIISKGDITNILAVQFNIGDIWTLGSVTAFAVYSLFIRQCPRSISLSSFNGFVFLIGTLTMLPLILFEYKVYGLSTFNDKIVIGILYAGIGCSVFAYILWTKSISIIGPVKAGFIHYTIPFFAAIEAVYFLDEKLTFASMIGGIFIIMGVLVATVERSFFREKIM